MVGHAFKTLAFRKAEVDLCEFHDSQGCRDTVSENKQTKKDLLKNTYCIFVLTDFML